MGGCCSSTSAIEINGRQYNTKRLLGEGGFSYVFLAEDADDPTRKFALKKILCHDEDALEVAVREAELYSQFDHNNLLSIYDYTVVRSKAVDGAKEVVMLMPLFRSGSLFDQLVTMEEAGNRYSETEALALFISICSGVAALHGNDPPLCHRDLKPANVMLSDQNSPVLIDFGSVSEARETVETRQRALEIEDQAAEHTTATFRPPELFDVKTGISLDERVDIWGLGCILYSIAFYKSPFDCELDGGSIALAVAAGRVEYPEENPYSDDFCALIDFMLDPEIENRPFIADVIDRARTILRQRLA